MVEWRETGLFYHRLAVGSFALDLWAENSDQTSWSYCVQHGIHRDYDIRQQWITLQATDAESAKREAVALFRAKLEAALKEIEGL